MKITTHATYLLGVQLLHPDGTPDYPASSHNCTHLYGMPPICKSKKKLNKKLTYTIQYGKFNNIIKMNYLKSPDETS